MEDKTVICKFCGKEMPRATQWDWRCSCGATYYYKEGFEYWEEPDGPSDDDDDIPQGCAACGNPLYPDCQYSCNMFDN